MMLVRSNRLWIILFLVTCISHTVIGEQRFVERPPLYQEVSNGENVQLRCVVHDKRGDCMWQKDRKPVRMQTDKYELASNRGNDCTLLIRKASLDYDDGFWECQVTDSDFTHQDALSSEQSRLLVKVKPRKPQLVRGERTLGTSLGPTLTLREKEDVTISCVSRYGNPAAFIKWYIGNKEVIPVGEQRNSTEVDNQKTWIAHSTLRVRGQRENHGLSIRCETVHPSSSTSDSTESWLNIHYSPEVRLETNQQFPATPEDAIDPFDLNCLVDANPPANITWYKDHVPLQVTSINVLPLSSSMFQGKVNSSTSGTQLHFEPVLRQDAGLYSCKAENIIGESSMANYRLDVQYGPKQKVLNGNNTVEETALLNSATEAFECPEFEANPPAQYKWVQLRGSSTESENYHVQNKGSGRRLRFGNITWSNEGDYRCIAFNTINGVKRENYSDVHYLLYVVGPPQIQSRPLFGDRDFFESIGWTAEPLHRLKSRFCSRPPPEMVAWQWGSSHIQAGESIPRYEALPLERIIENKILTNCYWAKLDIKDLQKEDARMYTLLVKSDKGQDSRKIRLIVKDPTEMRVIVAAIGVGLLLLLLLISISVYSLLRMRRGRYRQEVEEEGSIAADALYGNGASIDRQKSINSSHAKTYARKSSLDNGHGVYDYNHIAKQTHAMSPEALKVRRAPAVLQPPTIV